MCIWSNWFSFIFLSQRPSVFINNIGPFVTPCLLFIIVPPSFRQDFPASRHSNSQSIKKREVPFHSFEYISLSHPEPPFILSCILERIQKGRSMILCVVKHPLSNPKPLFWIPRESASVSLFAQSLPSWSTLKKVLGHFSFSSIYFTLSENSIRQFNTLYNIQYL